MILFFKHVPITLYCSARSDGVCLFPLILELEGAEPQENDQGDDSIV